MCACVISERACVCVFMCVVQQKFFKTRVFGCTKKRLFADKSCIYIQILSRRGLDNGSGVTEQAQTVDRGAVVVDRDQRQESHTLHALAANLACPHCFAPNLALPHSVRSNARKMRQNQRHNENSLPQSAQKHRAVHERANFDKPRRNNVSPENTQRKHMHTRKARDTPDAVRVSC